VGIPEWLDIGIAYALDLPGRILKATDTWLAMTREAADALRHQEAQAAHA
jgi:hypothetical protein